MREAVAFGVLFLVAAACSSTPRPEVVITKAEVEEFIRAVQPAVDEARKTFPTAKARYLAGLPAGSHFYVTTRLRDRAGKMEQVFVLVDAIRGETIDGRIWSDIVGIEGYSQGEALKVLESDVIDWTILDAEGREEGNYVGKLLDQLTGTSH